MCIYFVELSLAALSYDLAVTPASPRSLQHQREGAGGKTDGNYLTFSFDVLFEESGTRQSASGRLMAGEMNAFLACTGDVNQSRVDIAVLHAFLTQVK